jgi:hypothetical protein
MSRTWIETAEFGSVIMHCIECPDWRPVLDAEAQGDDPRPDAGGVPVWKITNAAAMHIIDAHSGKPTAS